MTNLECCLAVILHHREARQWSDAAVATDLIAQLGLDPSGVAAKANPALDPSLVTPDQVASAEKDAERSAAWMHELRGRMEAQQKAAAGPDGTVNRQAPAPAGTTGAQSYPMAEAQLANAAQQRAVTEADARAKADAATGEKQKAADLQAETHARIDTAATQAAQGTTARPVDQNAAAGVAAASRGEPAKPPGPPTNAPQLAEAQAANAKHEAAVLAAKASSSSAATTSTPPAAVKDAGKPT